MERIYKYPLNIKEEQVIEVIEGADIVSVIMQNGTPCLYALVDPSKEKTEKREIRIYGTGMDIPDSYVCLFIGTIPYMDGKIVLHVFEYLTEWNGTSS